MKCSQSKPSEEFHRSSKSKDGLHTWCKSCKKSYQKAYREKHKDKLDAYNKDWLRDNSGRAKKRARNYTRKKRKVDQVYRFESYMRSRMRKHFNAREYSKEKPYMDYLNESVASVIEHLNDNPYGFSYGDSEIELDHIVPLDNAKTIKDTEKLLDYRNLQLLPSKYNRYVKSREIFNKEHFEEWLKEEK